jgi:hypothetical protein
MRFNQTLGRVSWALGPSGVSSRHPVTSTSMGYCVPGSTQGTAPPAPVRPACTPSASQSRRDTPPELHPVHASHREGRGRHKCRAKREGTVAAECEAAPALQMRSAPHRAGAPPARPHGRAPRALDRPRALPQGPLRGREQEGGAGGRQQQARPCLRRPGGHTGTWRG